MVDADDFLSFAQSLLSNGQAPEIHLRMGAARAYYAMMHRVDRGFSTQGAGGHHAVIREKLLAKENSTLPEEALKYIRQYWDTIYNIRVRADYNIISTFRKSEADKAIAIVNNFMRIASQGSAK